MMILTLKQGILRLFGDILLCIFFIELITWRATYGNEFPISTSFSQEGLCARGYSYSIGLQSCYKINSTLAATRAGAAAACSADAAHLVDITSAQEQDFVVQLLRNDPILKSEDPGPDVGAWIGLMIPETFRWSDGSSLVYTAWAEGSNGRNEPDVKCVRMDSRYEYQWGDRDCDYLFHFVCEINEDICPEEYASFQLSCYKVYSNSIVTRAVAAAACSADAAHLVDITSAQEQDFVVQLLRNDPILKTEDPGPDVGAWIGLMIPETFLWSDGSALVYTAWAEGTNGRNEPDVKCVRMDSRYEYQWGDRDCTESLNFVCEKDPEQPPTRIATQYTTLMTADIVTTSEVVQQTRNELGIPYIVVIIGVVLVISCMMTLVIGCFLRKRKHGNSNALQPQIPNAEPRYTPSAFRQQIGGNLDINRNAAITEVQDVRVSVQPDGYVEFKQKPHDSESDLRISVKPNGYLEFKPQTGDVKSMSTSTHPIKHTYFDPQSFGRHKTTPDANIGTPKSAIEPTYYSTISDDRSTNKYKRGTDETNNYASPYAINPLSSIVRNISKE